MEYEKSLAAAASDSRVAIDIIYTGGVVGAPPPKLEMEGRPGTTASQVPNPWEEKEGIATSKMVFRQMTAVQGLREIAEITGGQFSAFTSGATALHRLHEATSFEYLLGYSPSNTQWDGQYRLIVVKVNRPDVTLLYRRGYFARDRFVPIDSRSLLTQDRMGAAAASVTELRGIQLTIKSLSVHGEGKARELTIDISIGALPEAAFTMTGDRHAARLDIMVFCGDAGGNLVGEMSQNIDLKLRGETYRQLAQIGIPYVAHVRLRGEPKHVKVIAYNSDADQVGTASVKTK
jgi:hypothetical protein